MSKSIKVEGADEIIQAFSNANSEINRVGRSWLKDWSDYGITQSQKHILSAGSVDTNELIQGLFYYIYEVSSGLEAQISPSEKADEYAYYVEEGSPPHWPNIDALQGWADRHGIPVWAVAASIAKKGTEPRKVFEKAFNDLDKQVNSELRQFAEAIASKL